MEVDAAEVAGFSTTPSIAITQSRSDNTFMLRDVPDGRIVGKIAYGDSQNQDTMMHNGCVLTSVATDRGYQHTVRDVWDLTNKIVTFTTTQKVKKMNCLRAANSYFLFVLHGSHNTLTIIDGLQQHQPFSRDFGETEVKKLLTATVDDRLYVYTMMKYQNQPFGLLCTDTLDFSQDSIIVRQQQQYPKIYDFTVSNNSLVLLQSSKHRYSIQGHLTNIDVESEATLNTATFNNQECPSLKSNNQFVILCHDKMYEFYHGARIPQQHSQLLDVNQVSLVHTVTWLNNGCIQSSKATCQRYGQDKDIVTNLKNIYNDMGQLDLQFELVLQKCIGKKTFNTLEDYSYSIFKYLLQKHPQQFIKAYFNKQNKQLTSHSNFSRFNNMSDRMRQEICQRVEAGDDVEKCIKATQLLLDFQAAMTQIVWREYSIYMQLRSQDNVNNAYRQSVEKYSWNRGQTESLWYVLTWLKAMPQIMTIESPLVNFLMERTRKIEEYRNNQKNQKIYNCQFCYFQKFFKEQWHKMNLKQILSAMMRSHPVEVLFVIYSSLPPTQHFESLFHLDKQQAKAAILLVELEDSPLENIRNSQRLQQLMNLRISTPPYFYIFLSWAAIQRGLIEQMLSIVETKVSINDSTVEQVIDLHIVSHKIEECYLLIKGYLNSILSVRAEPSKKYVELLLKKCIKAGMLMQLAKISTVLNDDEREYLKLELKKYDSPLKIDSFVRM